MSYPQNCHVLGVQVVRKKEQDSETKDEATSTGFRRWLLRSTLLRAASEGRIEQSDQM